MNLITEKLNFKNSIFGWKRYFKSFWFLIIQIFRSKSIIISCEVSRNLKPSANAPMVNKCKNTVTKIALFLQYGN